MSQYRYCRKSTVISMEAGMHLLTRDTPTPHCGTNRHTHCNNLIPISVPIHLLHEVDFSKRVYKHTHLVALSGIGNSFENILYQLSIHFNLIQRIGYLLVFALFDVPPTVCNVWSLWGSVLSLKCNSTIAALTNRPFITTCAIYAGLAPKRA